MKVVSLLIVDDEPFVCDNVVLKLSRMQYGCYFTPTCCQSGTAALALLEANAFDALITDIRMPFMTGIQLIKKAREKGFVGEIFVLSGYDDFNYVREAFTNGANDYLLKPVSASELEKKLLVLITPDGEQCAIKETKPAITSRNIMEYALNYIRSNYMNSNLSMDEVAKHVSVSYSHFSTLFKKETSVTFPTYLRNLRIEKAIELLRDPSIKISAICYRVGFKYPQQLSSDFKKVTGVYPTEYFEKNQIY